MDKIGQIIPPFSTSKVNIVLNKNVITQGEPVLGRYLKINFKRKNKECIALLRLIELTTENSSILNSEMAINANLLEGVKEKIQRNDIPVAVCEVLTAFEKNEEENRYYRLNLDTIIHSLENVEFVEENLIKRIISHIENEVFYIGKAINENFDIPVVFKPFSILNEAYHMLIVGQTGSGKSTEAKKILTAYAKNDYLYSKEHKEYKRMNCLILDPVGEFSKSFKGEETGHFPINLNEIWEILERDEHIKILGIDNIVFDEDDWNIFRELMISEKVFEPIGIKYEANQHIAINEIISFLRNDHKTLHNLSEILPETLINLIRNKIEIIYSMPNKRNEVRALLNSQENVNSFLIRWDNVVKHFNPENEKESIQYIISQLIENSNQTIIIDLSTLKWENPLKYMITYSILDKLIKKGEEVYKNSDEILNTLVVLDEAHRLVPAKLNNQEENYKVKTKEKIVTAFRETRKLGIGWMVISTRISNIDTEIWEHSRVKLFGFGLSTGKDAELIKELFGREVLELYKQKIGDPYDLMGERKHRFMLDGPVNIISRKIPEFYEAYNSYIDFKDKNNLDTFFIDY